MSGAAVERLDLLHLSPEALTQTANAGVVKRAVRELEGGYRPQWTLAQDGLLEASFSDGVRISWPAATPIQQVRCSCGAASVCRHRIILALAFRDAASASVAPDGDRDDSVAGGGAPLLESPGHASDDALARLIPASLLVRAAQVSQAGMSVDVRRRASGEPCDTARLPSATVRYWAGAAIEAARCDCVAQAACEHVALGVWAFRLADVQDVLAPAAQVRLGHTGERLKLDGQPFHAVVEALVRHGVTAGAAPIASALSHALDAARKLQATWLEHLLQDLERWSAAYTARSALYEAGDGVALLAELALRMRAGVLPGNARAVLGIGQAGETQLDRLRLVCLGARTTRDGEDRRTRLVLADTDTGTALVLTKAWRVLAADSLREAALRANERLAPGVRLEALAQGQLLAQQARRLADGSLILARARASQNSVLPQSPDWSQLGAPLRFDSVSALVALQRAQPTAQILPRHAARQFVVFTPQEADAPVYDATAQALLCVVRDAERGAVLLRRIHEGHTRHALDALAAAFGGQHGAVRHVAGLLHWNNGLPVIEPWAVACDSVIVPDLATSSGALARVALGQAPEEAVDPISTALRGVRSVLATLLHHGLVQLPGTWKADCARVQQALTTQSLHVLARHLAALDELVLAAQANPRSARVAPALLDLVALVQLHEDAQVDLELEQ